ncbi:hypothetical protein Tco_0438115 [Tanacetum coccineum]
MDDLNITMEEYIRLEEEKARRQGRTFDWQTARYSKTEYYENEDDSFTNLKTEYPAIVFDDISDATFSREPTVCPLDNNEIDFNISFDESDDEDYMIVFDENSFSYVAPLPHHDPRHPWLRYQVDGYDEGIVHSYEQRFKMIWGRPVNQVYVLDFTGLTNGMRQTLGDRLSMTYAGDDREALFTSHAWRRLFEVRAPLVREFMLEFFSTCRMSDTEMGLDAADTLCFQLGGARRRMTRRQFILALGLHSKEEMAEPRDFLGPAPSYVHIKYPVRRLYHRMIACSISGRGQGAEKVTGVDLFYLRTIDRGTANVSYLLAQYLFRHVKGRKSGARLFRGYFIGRLAAHFGLVSDQGLRGLSVVVSELLVIDLHELARLNICSRFGDTWAWVAPGPERQQAAAAVAPRATEDAPAADEGAQVVPAPVQAPQPPLPASLPRTMSQRIDRLEEEVRELRQSVMGLRGVIESSITEQTRVSNWMISCMTQLMDASGRTY